MSAMPIDTARIGPGHRTMAVPTRVAKKASSFQGSRYPLNPNPNVMKKTIRPVSQVSSRGRR